MSEIEFEVLDELYFVKSLEELQKSLHLSSEVLINTLISLRNKNWVRILDQQNIETTIISNDFSFNSLLSYKFVATKQGLLAHNEI